jgi:hypothetical protein
MRLEPLKQWICDTCGQVIERPEDGYVQFNRDDDGVIDDFTIVHHLSASPLKNSTKNGCYKYDFDNGLEYFLGYDGLVRLHSLLDAGKYHQPEYEVSVSNIRKWSETYKRLHLPYYEEARMYFERTKADGYFEDANEIYCYKPENLKAMIERYEKLDR